MQTQKMHCAIEIMLQCAASWKKLERGVRRRLVKGVFL